MNNYGIAEKGLLMNKNPYTNAILNKLIITLKNDLANLISENNSIDYSLKTKVFESDLEYYVLRETLSNNKAKIRYIKYLLEEVLNR